MPRSTTRRIPRTLLALGTAAALVMAGCGGDDDDSEGAASATPAAEASAPEESSAPATPAEAPAPEAAAAAPAATPEAPQASPPVVAPSAPKATAKATTAPKASAAKPASSAGSSAEGKAGNTQTASGAATASPTAPPSGGADSATRSAAPAQAGAANPGATDVGVTGDTIKFGGIYMFGYALGQLAVQPMHREIMAILKGVNDSGGIHGRKLIYNDCDDGAPDPARTKACYKKLVEHEKVFALMGGMTFIEGQYQADIERDQIPNVAPSSLYREVWQNPFSFPIHMDMTQEAIANAEWVVKKHNPKTFGIICLNSSEMLDACKKAEGALAAKGVKQVFKRVFQPGTPDMSGDIIAARAAGPDHILHYTVDPTITVRFFLDAQQQNYWPPKGISGNHLAGEAVGGLMGEYPSKGGYWTNTTYKIWGADYIAWHRRYVPSNKGLTHHISQGQWFGANVTMECLRKVGPNLTRKALVQCMTSQEWETGPGLGQRFLWQPSKRYSAGTGNTLEYMYQYINQHTQAEDDGTGNAKGLVLDSVIEAPAVDPHTGTGG